MIEAIAGALIVSLAVAFGYFVLGLTEAKRRWREGYLHGFNHAWDEKSKMDVELRERHQRDIRRRRLRLQVIKGGDEDVRRS